MSPNAKCSICGAAVYYYQSPTGGRVWFDELGPPWPKHPCMASVSTSTKISSFKDLFAFTGAEVRPEAAMRMAKELVAHALTDFREPKRHWPDEDLKAARLDVLDWMFRTHSTGGDHIIPIDEFMFLVNLIELRAKRVISTADLSAKSANLVSPDSIHAASIAESAAKMQVAAEKSKKTLSLIAMIRKHYCGSDDEIAGNVVQLYSQKDPD